ncbi:heterokaryon incompatibility protein-domain-containing protein [Lasiosphaeris hirsuta]|uniref:Heterokaryon incompatibility protein-domain-containing protein n=1 Tax=Lasiosphaeris hirsuta TaxID=260670 RepID=A0AA39ZVV3_9PEZI|nr:heterokaryon incompatibility protein-domain-containing protein [Lasiosphaeris hirsuta]
MGQPPSPPPIRRRRSYSSGEVDVGERRVIRNRPTVSRRVIPSPTPVRRYRSLSRAGYDYDDDPGRPYERGVTQELEVGVDTDVFRERTSMRIAPSPPPLHLHVPAPGPRPYHHATRSPGDTPPLRPLTPSRTHLSPPKDIRYRSLPSRGRHGDSSDDLSDSKTTRTSPSRGSWGGTLGEKGFYRYSRLGPDEFRLVRLLRRTKTAIKCEIIHESLLAPPRYVAISYAWGDAGDTRKIMLEGSSVPIPVSLYGALEALRQRKEDVLVWVDKLCIDQDNHEERSEQVRLMTNIYAKAECVPIWLGAEADDSSLGMLFLSTLADTGGSPEQVGRLLVPSRKREIEAVASLFERDYWSRLWVVQEVFNAKAIRVYCGTSPSLGYRAFVDASVAFRSNRELLNTFFPANSVRGRSGASLRSQFSVSQVLVHQGPAGFPDFRLFKDAHSDGSILLDALRACRRKLATEPRDKVFGILGVLPQEIRDEFPPDYNLSAKDVYTDIVDYLLTTTGRLDVICEAIHFPLHTSAVTSSLPSFVPDWSHIPETSSLAQKHLFSASGKTAASFKFLDERHNRLEISAVYLDTITSYGVAVGTLCTLTDYLMAFIQWRALLLGTIDTDGDEDYNLRVQEDFCRTLCLDQVPREWDTKPGQWPRIVFHLFASFIRERLPRLPLDRELRACLDDIKVDMDPGLRRGFIQDHFGQRMMGQCFCLTKGGLMGMGSGFMALGDKVVVPLGCDSPVLLRPEGRHGEYRFVGDIYIHGYMRGRAMEPLRRGGRADKYVLH